MKRKLLLLVCLMIAEMVLAESARERAERLLKEDPSSISGNIAMGVALLDENDVGGARQHLEKVVALKEDIPFVWYLLAMIYERDGDNLRAIFAWEKVLNYSTDRDSEESPRLRSVAEKHLRWLRKK